LGGGGGTAATEADLFQGGEPADGRKVEICGLENKAYTVNFEERGQLAHIQPGPKD